MAGLVEAERDLSKINEQHRRRRAVVYVRQGGGARLLTNPAYAGAVVFGRTRQHKRLNRDGRVHVKTVELLLEEWSF